MAEPKIVYDIVANAEGGGEVDRLAASLEQLDKAIDPAAAARAQELSAELQRLGAQQAAVARFQELSAATEKAAADLAAADAAVGALRSAIDASGAPTSAQAGRLEKLGAAAQAARTDLQAQTAALDASRGKLAALGIDANAAAEAEAALGAATKTIRSELQALGTSLQGVNARALVDDLKQLGQQQQGIQQLRDLGAATDKARAALTAAEGALQAYQQKVAGIEAPTAAQVNTQQRLAFAVDDARAKFTAQAAALEAAGGKLAALGVETSDLAAAEERLRTAAQATVAQIQQLGQQQAAVQRFQELAAATERARAALVTADAGLDAFRASIAATEAPTAAEAAELERLTAAARAAQVAVQAQALAQAEAGAALRAAGVDTDKLIASQAGARQQLSGTAAALASLTAEAQRTAGAAEKVAAAWQTLGVRSFRDVQTEITKVKASLADIQAVSRNPVELKIATEAAQAKLKALADEMTVTVGASADGLVSKFATVGAAIAGIGFAAKPIYDLAVKTETLRRVLEQTEGSAAGAEKQMEFLRATAQRAGVSITDISQAFVRFSSAARSSGISGQVVNDVFEATTRAAGNLGLSSEKVTLILDALGQMASKGVVQMEELRGQLGDSLPGALGLMAKGLGLTQAELIKVVESGQLLARDALPALASALATVGGNGAQVEGLSASFNRLKNVLVEAGQSLIDGPLGAAAGVLLTAFAGVLRDVTVVAVGFNQVLAVVGKTIALIAAALTGNIGSFRQFKEELGAILDESSAKMTKFRDRAYDSGTAAREAGAAAAEGGRQVAQGATAYDAASAAATRAAAAQRQAATAATASGTAHQATAAGANAAAQAQTGLAIATNTSAMAATNATVSWAKLTVDYATVNAEIERGVKVADKLVQAKKLEGEAAVTLAQISGNEYAALQAETTAAANNAQAQQALADKRQTEVAVLRAQLDAEKALAEQLGDPNNDRAKQITAIENSIAAKQAEAEASTAAAEKAKAEGESRKLLLATYADNSAALEELKAAYESTQESVADMTQLAAHGVVTDEQLADSKKRAAEAERLYRDAVNDTSTAAQREIATIESEQRLTQAGITVDIAKAAALEKVATAQGNTALATDAAVRGKQLEITAIEKSVDATKQEADELIKSLQVQRDSISATDPLIAQKQQEIDSRIKNAQAAKVEADARLAGISAIQAEIEALQRRAQAAAFANPTSLDLSGNKNAATKAASDASTAALKAYNAAQSIDDSVRVDLETRYKAGTLTAADLATAKANAEAQKNNYTNVTRSLGTAVDPIGRQDALAATRIAQSVLEKVTELVSAAAQPAGTIGGKAKATVTASGSSAAAAPPPAPAPAPTVAPAAAPTVAPASTSHTVTINLGAQTTTFATASEKDSKTVVAFLQTLESAARSAGYGG